MYRHEQRAIALGAVRSQLRAMGIDPVLVSAQDAHRVLQEIARQSPDLVAAQWYDAASSHQMQLFYWAWNQWCREHAQRLHESTCFQQTMNRLFS